MAEGKLQFQNQVITTLTSYEVDYIKSKFSDTDAEIWLADPIEKEMIKGVTAGKRYSYKIILVNVSGSDSRETILENYKSLVDDHIILQSSFLYKNLSEPVRVILNKPESSFPIIDIGNYSKVKQLNLIESVVSAETRYEFNPERDSMLRLKGFLLDKDNMVVLLSVYPFYNWKIGLSGLAHKIFKGVNVNENALKAIDSAKVEKINEKLVAKCVGKIAPFIAPVGNPLRTPGHLKSKLIVSNQARGSIYRALDNDFLAAMTEYCSENMISQQSLWMLGWAKLLGEYNETKSVVLLLNYHGNMLNALPVKIDLNNQALTSARNYDKYLEDIADYTDCSFDSLCKGLKIDPKGHFEILHNFMNVKETSTLEDISMMTNQDFCHDYEEVHTPILVNYQSIGENVGLTYVYDADSFYDSAIERIHDALIWSISDIIGVKTQTFDKNTYIKAADTNEVKMYKLMVAQKALYIQQTNLFNIRKPDELMKLAEKTEFANYAMGDTVVASGESKDAVAILAVGNLEESRMTNDGLVRTIRVLKAPEFFLYEGLGTDTTSQFEYSVVSNEAKVVWIDKDVMAEFLNLEPNNWRDIITAQNKLTTKMKKLWTMT